MKCSVTENLNCIADVNLLTYINYQNPFNDSKEVFCIKLINITRMSDKHEYMTILFSIDIIILMYFVFR